MISSAFQSLFGAPGGVGGPSGSGNATVPGDVAPSDPQDFVDAAVFVSESGRGYWLGPDFALNLSITSIDRLVIMPVDVASGLSWSFSLNTQGRALAPSLESITGTLTIGGGAQSVSLPGLVDIPGTLVLGGGNLTSLVVPPIAPFTGVLNLISNFLAEIPFGADWVSFAGNLSVRESPSLASLPFVALVTLSGLINASNCALLDPNFDSLTTITGSLDISGNPDATTFGLPILATCSGTLNLSGFASSAPFADLSDLSGVNFSGGTLVASGMGLSAHGLGTLTLIDFSLNLGANAITDVGMDDLVTLSGEIIFVGNDLSAAGAASFPALVTLSGSLILDSTNLESTSFSAPLLETIEMGGVLSMDSNNHSYLSLPSLLTCNGAINAGNCDLGLPNLTTIGADGNIGATGAGVTDVGLSSLADIGGTLNLEQSATDVIFPVLETVSGGGTLSLNASTGTVFEFPSLTSVAGTIDLNETGSLNTVSVDVLEQVPGTFSLLRSGIEGVSFPALSSIAGLVNLSECFNCTVIDLPSLLTINGELRIQQCVLDQASMNALFAQLAVNGTSGTGFIDFSGYQYGIPSDAPDFETVSANITIIY